MANTRLLKQSFAGGEISPDMFGRIEDAGYQNGLALCRNFMVRPQGAVENRPGFEFVRAVKNHGGRVRLLPFAYSDTDTLVLELGHEYCRFHTLGGTVMDGDVPYEIATPYREAEFFDIHYVQSADVMTLVHPNHAPRELRRYDQTDWRLVEIDFQPPLGPPASVSVTAQRPGGTDNQFECLYVVTAVAADGVSESRASAVGRATNNLYLTGNSNTVSWPVVAGASRYKVYKKSSGLFGYIGQTTELSLKDDNIAPDMSVVPPVYDDVFASGGITAVAVDNGGSGYANKGGIAKVAVSAPGENLPYWLPDKLEVGKVYAPPGNSGYDPKSRFRVVLQHNGGAGAVLGVNLGGKYIHSVVVKKAGDNYVAPALMAQVGRVYNNYGDTSWRDVGAQFSFSISGAPKVKVNDPTGSGAVLLPVVSNGVITGIEVVRKGYGYSNPTITIESGVGGGAVLGDVALEGKDYPAAVSYFQQRRVFAGTKSKPQNVWMTKSGTESDMSYSIPTRADDRIAFRIAAREASMVRHIVPLTKLMLLSSGAEWFVTGGDALTPANVSVQPQSYVGASNVQPVIVNNTLIYGAARGGHVRELAYNWQANGYVTGDLSLRCSHLFDGLEVLDMALAKAPYPVVWAVSSNGTLLGCTYIPEHQIGAWHQHVTDGVFESCACVAEGEDDVLYCVVRREVGGVSVRYIERMHSRRFEALEDAFFVDSGLSYRGDETDTLTGLEHLEGKTVSILGDGAVMPQQVVANGQIRLPVAVKVAHVGLPVGADLQTVPLAFASEALGQGRMKNANKLWLRVYRSSGVFAGQSDADLTEYKQRTVEAAGTPPQLKTDEIEIMLKPQWNSGGQIFVRQIHPLPLTVLNMTVEVAIGG